MRYIIGLLVTVGLIVLVLFLLLSGGSSTPTPKQLQLIDYAQSSANAQLLIDGPIVANQQHDEIQIDVNRNQVVYTRYTGYDQVTTVTQSYENNDRSFAVFLRALQHEGFTVGNTDPSLRDERGYCPLGNRYIYTFRDGSKQLMRFWSTSCGDTTTAKGKIPTINSLFKHQVPDYVKLSAGTGL